MIYTDPEPLASSNNYSSPARQICHLLLVLMLTSFSSVSTVIAAPPEPFRQLLDPHANLAPYGRYNPATDDTISKFDSFNKKAEKFFKYCPVPLYSYSQEAGNIFGLAKYNVFDLYSSDTVTDPSKVSGVFTASTEGRVNFSLATDIIFKENKHIIMTYINYKLTPEYILGIGNDVTVEDVEQIEFNRLRHNLVFLFKTGEYGYVGPGYDISYYYNVETDTNTILIDENALGLEGGTNVGLGVAGAFDSRDNRYNARTGTYFLANTIFYGEFIGSEFQFFKLELDGRKFYTLNKKKHVLALQATATYTDGDVPFYDLAMLGGDSQMRGYYEGGLRDNVLVDAQAEYRLPIWNIFGMVGWLGTGRVYPSVSSMTFDDFWLSYGVGLRLKVDSAHDVNLRFDFGWGYGNGYNDIQAFNIGFSEAF
jgi:hypothetical protein